MPKPKGHAYNVTFSLEDDERLAALQVAQRATGAVVIRQALEYYYRHVVLELPCCGNGHPCFVPQMHTPLYAGRKGGGGHNAR